jgi:hypothetical protein
MPDHITRVTTPITRPLPPYFSRSKIEHLRHAKRPARLAGFHTATHSPHLSRFSHPDASEATDVHGAGTGKAWRVTTQVARELDTEAPGRALEGAQKLLAAEAFSHLTTKTVPRIRVERPTHHRILFRLGL